MKLRDEIVDFVTHWQQRAELPKMQLLTWCGLSRNRFYDWVKRKGQVNQHQSKVPKKHWVLPEEKQAIVRFHQHHSYAGYRHMTYMMIDANIAFVSPSTTYRVLKSEGLLGARPGVPNKKGTGFIQPTKPHEHWHIDFSFVQIRSVFYFLVAILDGYSRAILSWSLGGTMTDWDAQIVLQQAHEKYPNNAPRLISDNGQQFLSREFQELLGEHGMTHVRTSPSYPQSNGKYERFNRTIKEECIYKQCPLDEEEAQVVIGAYVIDYNETRLHSAIGYVTPLSRLEGKDEAIQAERKEKLIKAKSNREAEFRRQTEEEEKKDFFFGKNPR